MSKGDIKLMIGFTIFLFAVFFILKGVYSKDKNTPTPTYTHSYSEECDCEDYRNEIERIKDNLYDIIINPDDYSKKDIIRKIKGIY